MKQTGLAKKSTYNAFMLGQQIGRMQQERNKGYVMPFGVPNDLGLPLDEDVKRVF